MTYFFALGTNHSLCKAEILTVLAEKNIFVKIIEASQETLIIETDQGIDPKPLIDQLGSAAKIGTVLNCLPLKNFLDLFSEEIKNKNFWEFFLNQKDKFILFGLSVYGAGAKFKDVNQAFYLAPKIISEIKSTLLSQGLKSGFVPLKERILSTVSVDKNNLLSEGFEICLLAGKENVYLAKTLAVQDYESYSKRDYGRPNRDPASGMLPPKIAKIMINLCAKPKESTLFDPFCGSGTILEEAILLGYKNIIGTDNSQKAISDTKINLDWLFNNYPLVKKEYNLKIDICEVKNICSVIKKESVDLIVTEPYLGSSKMSFLKIDRVKTEIQNLEKAYRQFFGQFKEILKKNGVIAIVFPSIYSFRQTYTLKILGEIEKTSFKTKNFLPESISSEDRRLLNLEITDRNSLVYYRPGQTISREIFLFKRS